MVTVPTFPSSVIVRLPQVPPTSPTSTPSTPSPSTPPMELSPLPVVTAPSTSGTFQPLASQRRRQLTISQGQGRQTPPQGLHVRRRHHLRHHLQPRRQHLCLRRFLRLEQGLLQQQPAVPQQGHAASDQGGRSEAETASQKAIDTEGMIVELWGFYLAFVILAFSSNDMKRVVLFKNVYSAMGRWG